MSHAKELLRVPGSKSLAYGLVAMFAVAACVLNYPGHLSYDSLVQLSEGRSGRFASLHPPFASAAVALLDRLWGGTALLMFVDVALLALALGVMLRAMPRTSPLSNLLLLVFLASPVTLIYSGILWKDVLFAHLELLAFALLMSSERRARWWKTALIVVVLAVAAQVRPQGLIIALVACIALAFVAWPRLDRHFTARAASGLALFAGTMMLSLILSALPAAGREGAAGIAQGNAVPLLLLYDLAGIIHHRPELDLTILAAGGADGPLLKQLMLTQYTPQRFDSLDIYRALPPSNQLYAPLLKQWLHAVATNPGAYLTHRLDVFSWQLGLHDPAQCLPVYVGIDDSDPALLNVLHLREGPSPYSGILWNYAATMFRTPVFRGVAYVAVLVVSLLLLARAGFARHLAATSLAIAALLFALSYLAVGIACDFRYLYFTLVAAMACAIYATASAGGRQTGC